MRSMRSMTMHPTDHRLHRRTPRGAALVLVLVALAIGLMMVATFLDGRRESVPVSVRISDAAQARRTAESGLELIVTSILASDDWIEEVAAGTLDAPFRIADGLCTARVLDATTNRPPTEGTLQIRIACTADIDGLAMIAEETFDVSPMIDRPLDLAFGETALLAESQIRLEDDAALLAWAGSDGGPSAPLVVGTLGGDPHDFEVTDTAITSGCEVVMVDARCYEMGEDPAGIRLLPDALPAIAAPTIPIAREGRTETPVVLDATPATDIDAPSIRIRAGTRILIEGDRILHSRGDFRIESGAAIEVARGTLVIDGDALVSIHDAEIAVAPAGRLLIRGGRELRIEDGGIGPTDATDRDALTSAGMLPVEVDPNPVNLTGGPGSTIVIEGDAMVTAVVIAPDSDVRVEDDVLLHGRIVAEAIEIGGRAVVYAAPDDGRVVGLTSPQGPHRDEDGDLLPALQVADRTSVAAVASIAEAIETPVVSLDESNLDTTQGWRKIPRSVRRAWRAAGLSAAERRIKRREWRLANRGDK